MSRGKKMVDIDLELEEDVLLNLCLMAHERDITLNQLFGEIIQKMVDELGADEQENLENRG